MEHGRGRRASRNEPTRVEQNKRRLLRVACYVVCCVVMLLQWSIFFVVLYGDIGFYRSGRYGLDVGDLYLLTGLYLMFSVIGVAASIVVRAWWFGGIMVAFLILHLITVMTSGL